MPRLSELENVPEREDRRSGHLQKLLCAQLLNRKCLPQVLDLSVWKLYMMAVDLREYWFTR